MQNGELPADTFFPIPDYVTTGEGVQRTGGGRGRRGGGRERWCENTGLSVKQSDPRFDVLIVSCPWWREGRKGEGENEATALSLSLSFSSKESPDPRRGGGINIRDV